MKRARIIPALFLIGFFTLIFQFLGCDKDKNPNLLANEQLYEYMDYWYLWYNQMPEVDPENYASPAELLEALRFNSLDRWSYITTRQEMEAYYDEGTYVGYGFGTAFDQYNNCWISFVFRDSPLAEFGIDRGWRIFSIDGSTPTPQNLSSLIGSATVGIEKNFVFLSPSGDELPLKVEKKLITMNTVIKDSIYTVNSIKVGYFVFSNFINPSENELNGVFSKFLEQGVTELIVDLRYNTGGSLAVSTYLAGLIAGQIANAQIFATLVFNDKRQDENVSYSITTLPNSLNLSRVVFITTGSTASASEVLINGLKPHIDVVLVGNTTYGKPVGMRAEYYNNWAFVPICFRVLNANGEGDFYDGIQVDLSYADGISYPFGDLNENSLGGAIAYISGSIDKKKQLEQEYILSFPPVKGLSGEIGAW